MKIGLGVAPVNKLAGNVTLSERSERRDRAPVSESVGNGLMISADVAKMARQLFVYILSSPTGELYVGVTNNLARRIWEHRNLPDNDRAYTARHGIKTLVYFEVHDGPTAAIRREKEIKGWTRQRKLKLVESSNPAWQDLGKSLGLY